MLLNGKEADNSSADKLNSNLEPAYLSSIRSDEGLTLETSAFKSLYGGQFTLSTQ